MNLARTFEVFRQEFTHNLRRPLFWVQILLIGFFVYMLSTGRAQIASGDARVGGKKAFLTSEFAFGQTLILLVSLIHVFFISVAAGMSVIRDDEQKVGELLHSSPLRPHEYIRGKYLAVLATFVTALAFQVGFSVICNHVLPHGGNAEYVGPLLAANYLRPALVFALPLIVLFTGACFAIGGASRLPVLVFSFPIGVLLVDAFFLWEWSPSWLPLGWNRVLQFLDPSGLRWLKETWLTVDRGVDFYNTQPIGLDGLVIAQRVLCVAVGLGAVAWYERRFRAQLRGARVNAALAARALEAARSGGPAAAAAPAELAPLASLGMTARAPGPLAMTFEVMRAELLQLVKAPGLYLFVPLILIQTLLNEYGVGAFDTPLLNTAGSLASGMMNTLTLLVSMVILFYTTESLQRERGSGIGAIYYATPLRTGAMLAGKTLANTVLALAIVLACFLGCLIVLAVQGRVPMDPLPFAIVWGLLLAPTYVLWAAFVSAVFAATSNRYATYAIGLGVMMLSGWFQMRGKMNWVFNWNLWSSTKWTDIATFQYDALPLALNRLTWLLAAVLFGALTLRWFERRERDATHTLLRLRPGAMARAALSLAPFLLPPLVAGSVLAWHVGEGYQGAAAKKQVLDYWRKNIQTWKDAPVPALAGVDLDVRFDPPKHAFTVKGKYVLENTLATPMARFPLTVNPRWKKLSWTQDGKPASTESRAGLVIVNPSRPLQPGERMSLEFSYEGRQPDGVSRNGGYEMEFVTPQSIVLTGFSGVSFVPMLGFNPDDAVEAGKNDSDPKEWADDWWKHAERASIPSAGRWFDVHMKVDVPADLLVNATGEKIAERVAGGRRVSEWRTDHPVRIFNLVAGRWQVKQREGVAVYYDVRHPYNVDDMLDALEGARRWYGEWFAPYPWKQLRLSEFAGLPTYAQAPAGNITFSEGIGFLTRSTEEADAAYWIAAHEAAHQWWPNMAMIADGPGTAVMSEGMSHFSALLLVEQARGERQRQAFAKQMEERYGRLRQSNSERALTKLDGRLPADTRIWYDKGGWALWMLHRFQGRERSLAAIREYMATYRDSKTPATLEDYLRIQRAHAADTVAFERFAKQWFHEVVVPHYLIDDARVVKQGGEWVTTATLRNVGTGDMTFDAAVVAGDRWPAKGKKAKPWREARERVTLGPRAKVPVTIRSPFEPQRLVLDPDVTVLMLERKKAEVALAAAPLAAIAK